MSSSLASTKILIHLQNNISPDTIKLLSTRLTPLSTTLAYYIIINIKNDIHTLMFYISVLPNVFVILFRSTATREEFLSLPIHQESMGCVCTPTALNGSEELNW